MTGPAILLLLAGLGAIAWVSARARAMRLQTVARATGRRDAVHSLPGYHGWYVALWLFAPAAIFLAVWSSVSPALITNQVLASEAAQGLPSFGFERGAILSDARDVAQGRAADVRLCAQRVEEPRLGVADVLEAVLLAAADVAGAPALCRRGVLVLAAALRHCFWQLK